MIGKEVGRYIVLDTLGRGGMGTIFEAFDRSLDRKVALKLLHPGCSANHLDRLVREARALARLSHPNVVQVYEVAKFEGETFIAMELVQGQTLRKWSRREPRPDWRACVELFRQAGLGLVAAHAQGLVHRDFKPSNVLVDDQGRVRVLDFGLVQFSAGHSSSDLSRLSESMDSDPSSSLETDAPLTEVGTVMGTPAYMSPEQIRGDKVDERSDQFSFCVALFEMIHGERPFGRRGLSARQLEESTVTIADDAITTSIPSALHALILRGLSLDPSERWPTMAVLVEQLERLAQARRRRGRWIALGAASIFGSALLGAGLAYRAEVARRCTAAPALMAEAWNDDQRQQIEASIMATALPYAATTWRSVEAKLDGYAEAWVETHTQACEATRITQQQSERTLELRMSCLRDHKVALVAAINELGQADATTVENATEMMLGLPALERCDDVDRLRQRSQRVPPPEDPVVAAEVERLRERLAEVRAQIAAGDRAEGIELVEQVIDRAEVLRYEPLRGEATFYRGSIYTTRGEYAQAESDLLEAYQIALRIGHDELARRASRTLAYVIGDHQARHSDGLLWGQTALPLAERSDDLSHLALTISDIAILHMRQGRYDEAEAMHRRALEIREGAVEPGHPGIALHIDNLARVFFEQGRFEQAEREHRRALEIREQTLGAEHPEVCESLSNLANVMTARGRYAEAEELQRRALANIRQIEGAPGPSTAMYLNNLSNALRAQGRSAEAEASLREALEIRQRTLGSEHPDVAQSHFNLGGLFFQQGRVEEAERLTRRALELYEKSLGPDHPMVGNTTSNLGVMLKSKGQLDDAMTYFERALAIMGRAHDEDHPDMAFALVNMAGIEITRGNLPLAMTHAQRTIALLEASGGHPSLLGKARFYLAQALWPDEAQRPRARALVEQALPLITDAELRTIIEQWWAENVGGPLP